MVYIVLEFSEQMGSPGSSPTVAVHAFASKEGQQDFVEAWDRDKEQNDYGYERAPNGWYSIDCHYWLESKEVTLSP